MYTVKIKLGPSMESRKLFVHLLKTFVFTWFSPGCPCGWKSLTIIFICLTFSIDLSNCCSSWSSALLDMFSYDILGFWRCSRLRDSKNFCLNLLIFCFDKFNYCFYLKKMRKNSCPTSKFVLKAILGTRWKKGHYIPSILLSPFECYSMNYPCTSTYM